MKRDDYIYASTRIRMHEKKLLSPAIFDRLVQAESLERALHILQETRYSDRVTRLERSEDYEVALAEELAFQANVLDELAEDADLKRLLFLKYDYHNVKILVKERLTDRNFSGLAYPFGSLFIPEVKDWIDNPMKNPRKNRLQEAIEEARATYQETGDAQMMDFVLDRAYFEELFSLSQSLGNEFFIDFARDYADFTNVLAFHRLVYQKQTKDVFDRVFVHGGELINQDFMAHFNDSPDSLFRFIKSKTKSEELVEAARDYLEEPDLRSFEKARDQFASDRGLRGADIPYGPEVIYSYLLRLETEIQNLRIVLAGKQAGVDPATIQERMRSHV